MLSCAMEKNRLISFLLGLFSKTWWSLLKCLVVRRPVTLVIIIEMFSRHSVCTWWRIRSFSLGLQLASTRAERACAAWGHRAAQKSKTRVRGDVAHPRTNGRDLLQRKWRRSFKLFDLDDIAHWAHPQFQATLVRAQTSYYFHKFLNMIHRG